MTSAEEAYRAAQEEIALLKDSDKHHLNFNQEKFQLLERLPPELAELKHLTHVEISSTRVSDISQLVGLSDVQWLSMDKTQVRDLGPVSELKHLRYLSAEHTMVEDLAPLSGLQELASLSLRNTEVRHLTELAGIKGLKSLHVDRTNVNELSPLTGMTDLLTVWLDDTEVSDLSPLSGCTEVTSLWLDRTKVRDLSPISSMTKLEWLSIDRTEVSDLTPLIGMQQMEALWVTYTKVVDLRPITLMPKLMLKPKYDGLLFEGCEAALQDKRIGEIAAFKRPRQRARTLVRYLENWVPPIPTGVDEQSSKGLRYRVGSKGVVEYDPEQEIGSPTDQQRSLHSFLLEDTADLIILLGGGHNQPHATVLQKLKRYETGLGTSFTSLNTMVVWKVGNDLRLILEADKARHAGDMTHRPALDADQRAGLQGLVTSHNAFVSLHPDLAALDQSGIDPASRHVSLRDQSLLKAFIDAIGKQTRLIVSEVVDDLRDLQEQGLGATLSAVRASSITEESLENLIKAIVAQAIIDARKESLSSRIIGDLRATAVGAVATGAAVAVGPIVASNYPQLVTALQPYIAGVLSSLHGKDYPVLQAVNILTENVMTKLRRFTSSSD